MERATGLRDTVAVGAVLQLARGSAGKVLLAWAEDRGRYADLVAEPVLEEIRRRGWAESVAEREEGVASVSAPVFDASGSVVSAAVSASGPIARLGDHPGDRLAERVVAAAREIERALGVRREPQEEPRRSITESEGREMSDLVRRSQSLWGSSGIGEPRIGRCAGRVHRGPGRTARGQIKALAERSAGTPGSST